MSPIAVRDGGQRGGSRRAEQGRDHRDEGGRRPLAGGPVNGGYGSGVGTRDVPRAHDRDPDGLHCHVGHPIIETFRIIYWCLSH